AAETGARRRFLRARRLHAIHQNIRVMHHALVAGPYFDAFKPACSTHGSAKNKIPVLVAAAGREQVRLFRLDDQVRRARLPAFCKFWTGRQVGRRAFHRALFYPMSDRGDLCVGESKLIREFKFAGLEQPRRHESALRNGGDLACMRFCVLIGKQWEGRRFAGAMARGAVVKQYGSDSLVKRDLRICRAFAGFLRRLGCREAARRVRQEENKGKQGYYLSSSNHSRSEIKHPTASVVDTGGFRPLLAASMASANSCVVAARRACPMCS